MTCQSLTALRRRRPGLWGSCRLNLALMCLAATFGFFLMRLNLSFALVCMVRQTKSYANDTSSSNKSSANLSDDIITASNPSLVSSASYDDDVDDLYSLQVNHLSLLILFPFLYDLTASLPTNKKQQQTHRLI